jgi:folylpolyglutamate synthase/dihydropteroate synthase
MMAKMLLDVAENPRAVGDIAHAIEEVKRNYDYD